MKLIPQSLALILALGAILCARKPKKNDKDVNCEGHSVELDE